MDMFKCSRCGKEFRNQAFLTIHECGSPVPAAFNPQFASDVLSAPTVPEPEVFGNNMGTPVVTAEAVAQALVSYYTAYGQARFNEILTIANEPIPEGFHGRLPVLLTGPTGGGKSHIIRDIAHAIGLGYAETNSYPGMDVSLWFGMHRPVEREHGIGLEWQPGLLSAAAENGSAFFMEEATRAPQDGIGRTFGVLEPNFRYLSLPEKGELSTPVHDDFWFIATANPATAGYAVQRMDRAFNSRFVHIEIDQPMADEARLLDDLLGNHQHREAFWRTVLDCRNHPESFINTRDIIISARLIRMGIDPVRAIEIGIAVKYGDFKQPIMQSANMHFGRTPSEEVIKENSDG